MPPEVQNASDLLLSIISVINSSLNPDEVLDNVMDQLITLTKAERGCIAYVDDGGEVVFRAARNMDQQTLNDPKFEISRTLIQKVASSGQGELLLSAMDDPRFAQNKSIVAKGLRSVLCVPLLTRHNDVLGVVWVDNKMQAGVFNNGHLEMLTQLGREAANAIQHANQYHSLSEMKTYQDSIFESLSSGVVAVDTQGLITRFNRVAEDIFALKREDVENRPIREALHGRAADMFAEIMFEVMEKGKKLEPRSHSGYFAGAGNVELVIRAAPLMTPDRKQIGATMIVEDVSEMKTLAKERDAHAEAKKKLRETLGKLVSEDVAELVQGKETLHGAGETREVSVLFIDINGFTARCEALASQPERVIAMLNRYFSEMCEVVVRNKGFVKQFVGDEMMVLFNATRETKDHPMLALWTAIEMVDRLQEMAADDPGGQNGFYEVKIGVHTGRVVYGAVGAQDRMEFAAVGDTVNLTSRVMNLNKILGSRILITEDVYLEAYHRVARGIELVNHGAQQIRGRTLPIRVFEVHKGSWA